MKPATREGGQTSHSMKFNLMAYAGYLTYIPIHAAALIRGAGRELDRCATTRFVRNNRV
jgi:hypothetical protein